MGARDARRRGEALTLNADGEIVPEVAQSAGKVSEFEWDIDLKPDYKFSDGTPVTAHRILLVSYVPLATISAHFSSTSKSPRTD